MQIGMNAETMLLTFATFIAESKDKYQVTDNQIELGRWSDELVESIEVKGKFFSWYDYIGKEASDIVDWYEIG